MTDAIPPGSFKCYGTVATTVRVVVAVLSCKHHVTVTGITRL